MKNYPNIGLKKNLESLITPKKYMEYLRKMKKYPSFEPPDAVILCYQRSLYEFAKKNYQVTTCDGFFPQLQFLNKTNNKIAVMGQFGIGAASAAIIMEELIAYGVKKFISMGTAGSLQTDLGIGELVLCDKAICDEGTSRHYLDIDKFSFPSVELTNNAENVLTAQKIKFKKGTSWTIDAPYRETVQEVRQYRSEGVLTVEMEASALFAVAEYRNIPIASLLTISDLLHDDEWHPEFHSSRTQVGLEKLLEMSIEIFKD